MFVFRLPCGFEIVGQTREKGRLYRARPRALEEAGFAPFGFVILFVKFPSGRFERLKYSTVPGMYTAERYGIFLSPFEMWTSRRRMQNTTRIEKLKRTNLISLDLRCLLLYI